MRGEQIEGVAWAGGPASTRPTSSTQRTTEGSLDKNRSTADVTAVWENETCSQLLNTYPTSHPTHAIHFLINSHRHQLWHRCSPLSFKVIDSFILSFGVGICDHKFESILSSEKIYSSILLKIWIFTSHQPYAFWHSKKDRSYLVKKHLICRPRGRLEVSTINKHRCWCLRSSSSAFSWTL